MSATPMDLMLDRVEWTETGAQPDSDDLPYATHSGVLEILGHRLRCFQLNTGERVFDAADVEAFFLGGKA